MSRKPTVAEPFVLWGAHPAHANGAPLKLSAWTKEASERRAREGWTRLDSLVLGFCGGGLVVSVLWLVSL